MLNTIIVFLDPRDLRNLILTVLNHFTTSLSKSQEHLEWVMVKNTTLLTKKSIVIIQILVNIL